ncbi:hypothetical protein HID58_022656 [Brassica napus]|uniref:F-box domain-containing protein n=1 Tax=Brassica napus TaxID=3708 RepID=A0ABQ8D067_BRANA|nr:hypothetical protein HID58_022656 [Brassica napus]
MTLGRHMENLNLASLPPSIIHQILSEVVANNICDVGQISLIIDDWFTTILISHMITTQEVSGYWDHDKYGMFWSLFERIDANSPQMDQKQSGDVIIVYGSMQPRPSAMKYIRLLMSGQLKIIYALTLQ